MSSLKSVHAHCGVAPERVTVIPLPEKILKLILAELASIFEDEDHANHNGRDEEDEEDTHQDEQQAGSAAGRRVRFAPVEEYSHMLSGAL
jgi:hypothetical protein